MSQAGRRSHLIKGQQLVSLSKLDKGSKIANDIFQNGFLHSVLLTAKKIAKQYLNKQPPSSQSCIARSGCYALNLIIQLL